jgi:molecular chaperone Hsp33
MNTERDVALRAMTNDGSLRVIVVDTTETVRAIVAAQRVTGEDARWLGELVTGTVMIRETMSPDLRVQGILQGVGGRGGLVADAHPDGGSRGLVQRATNLNSGAVALGDGARLQMMRTLPRGSVQQGIVRVEGETGVSGALMLYLQESEQVESAVAVATVMNGAEVVSSGGYLVQLLPELDEVVLTIVTARLQSLPSMASLVVGAPSPDAVMKELLKDLPFTELARSPLRFQCRCDRVRLLQAMATVSRSELEAMVAEAKPLEIGCDYCNTQYVIEPAELRGLLRPN